MGAESESESEPQSICRFDVQCGSGTQPPQ